MSMSDDIFPADDADYKPHTSHWGVFSARWRDDTLDVRPYPKDPDPNRLIYNFSNVLRHKARVAEPMIRRGWLERGPGPDSRRGRDEFVPVSWEKAMTLLSAELARVKDRYGPGAVFGGSYGWSSAGRFHHAQSQVHRFLNIALGGYVKSMNSYSSGAASVLIPKVICDFEEMTKNNVSWDQIAEHSDIVLAFGGMALKNSMVAGGSISQHIERPSMARAQARGCKFVLISPLRCDLPEEAGAEWLGITPGTDVALMLALVHTLVSDGQHDQEFLDRYTVGWPLFKDYVFGQVDGQPKDVAWASKICGISEETILSISRQLAGRRVLVVVSHSLQRSRHGEQPVWMGAVLASVLGQIGLPGGGYAYALGAIGYYGRRYNAVSGPTLSQGKNGVKDFIPVARISDMLLNPGATYRYSGQTRTYPDIKVVYWAGGNPFHHHQDLNRLREAFARVDTLVVHELAWTGTARHADFVLPCTMSLEREDIGYSSNDPLMVAMHPIAEPYGQARDDYAIFSDLAERLGRGEAFTEGRTVRRWLEYLYEKTRFELVELGASAPSFEEFWKAGTLEVPQLPDDGGQLRSFRMDPIANALPTPSGKIEIFSEEIASFNDADCPGHPTWLGVTNAPSEQTPFILVANQPKTRLHSQLDFGDHSVNAKMRGREIACMHSADAAALGIKDGDIIRLFNERGACLAAISLTQDIVRGIIQLPTGAWYDPSDPEEGKSLCVHGNPNVLTCDVGTSAFAQGCTGQLTTVNVERFDGNLPPIRTYDPPTSTEE